MNSVKEDIAALRDATAKLERIIMGRDDNEPYSHVLGMMCDEQFWIMNDILSGVESKLIRTVDSSSAAPGGDRE